MYAHYLALMFGVGRKPQNSFIPMGPKNSMAGMPTYLTCIYMYTCVCMLIDLNDLRRISTILLEK